MTDRVGLLENKVDTVEVLLMSLIQAVNELLPGTASATVDFVEHQAGAAKRRGDDLAYVLLTSAAKRVGYICDLPGYGSPDS